MVMLSPPKAQLLSATSQGGGYITYLLISVTQELEQCVQRTLWRTNYPAGGSDIPPTKTTSQRQNIAQLPSSEITARALAPAFSSASSPAPSR